MTGEIKSTAAIGEVLWAGIVPNPPRAMAQTTPPMSRGLDDKQVRAWSRANMLGKRVSGNPVQSGRDQQRRARNENQLRESGIKNTVTRSFIHVHFPKTVRVLALDTRGPRQAVVHFDSRDQNVLLDLDVVS